MTWQIPQSVTNTVTNGVTVDPANDLFVSAGVTIASIFNSAAYLSGGAGQRAVIHGTLVGTYGLAVVSGQGLSVTIGEAGRITGHSEEGALIDNTNFRLVNRGVLETLNPSSVALSLDSGTPGSNDRIVNTGTIEGINYGIKLAADIASFRLDNSGLLRGEIYSFKDESGSTDTIFNTGRIIGDVLMGAGNDRFDGRGGRLDGELFGGAGRDRLTSGADGDRMHGGDGNDTMTGGGGADRFVFDSTPGGANADDITDFGGADRILLQDTNFRVLPQGALAAGAFRANASGLAVDGNDRIIYETDTGWLRYDVDGRGGADSFRFAHLDANLSVNAGDFFVI